MPGPSEVYKSAEAQLRKVSRPNSSRYQEYLQQYPYEDAILPVWILGDLEPTDHLSKYHFNTSEISQATQERKRRRQRVKTSLEVIQKSDVKLNVSLKTQFQTEVFDLAETTKRIPRLVMVGDQSVGKSNLAIIFSKTNFLHTDTTFATRCPTEVRVRFDTKDQYFFNTKEVKLDDLKTEVKNHMENLGENVSSEAIIIELRSSTVVMDIDWIDLPGVPNPHLKSRYDTSLALVRKYAFDEFNENVIVYVFNAAIDIENCSGELLAIIDELKKRNPNRVLAFGNFVNLLAHNTSMSHHSATKLFSSWNKRLNPIRPHYGGVEVDIKLKELPHSEFKVNLQEKMDSESSILLNYFSSIKSTQNKDLVDHNKMGVKDFGMNCQSTLTRSRTKSLRSQDEFLRSEIEKIEDDIQRLHKMQSESIGVQSIENMFEPLAQFSSLSTSDATKGIALGDIEQVTWADLGNNIVFQILPESLLHFEQLLQNKSFDDYPIPIIDKRTPLEWDDQAQSDISTSDNEKGSTDSVNQKFLNERTLCWLAEMQDRAELVFIRKMGMTLLGDLFIEHWWRIAMAESGPNWELFHSMIQNYPFYVNVFYLTEMYPKMIWQMSTMLNIKQLLESMAYLEYFVVRETIRIVVHSFLTKTPERAKPLEYSNKLAHSFNDIICHQLNEYLLQWIEKNKRIWKDLLESSVDMLEPYNHVRRLEMWNDFTEIRHDLKCHTFFPVFTPTDINPRQPENLKDVLLFKQLKEVEYDKFAKCCKLFMRVRLIKLIDHLLARARRDFGDIFTNNELFNSVRDLLIPRNVSSTELLEKYEMTDVSNAIQENIVSLQEAKSEVDQTRDVLHQAIPILQEFLEERL